MQITSSTGAAAIAPDLVRQMGAAGASTTAQTKVAAQQFEAILMRQFLDKSVGSMMGQGAGSDVYGYMLTDVLSQKLAQGGGLGMAAILERQFSGVGANAGAAAGGTAAATGTAQGTGTAAAAGLMTGTTTAASFAAKGKS